MATLDSLKQVLRQTTTASSPKQSLSDAQYSSGFDVLMQSSRSMAYRYFIIPQLSQLFDLLGHRRQISVLEIGPGPKSVLGHLPERHTRRITRYTAYEPNCMFATRLDESLSPPSMDESPLPCLDSLPIIHQVPFVLEENAESSDGTSGVGYSHEKYDIILFCHSMYGMKPRKRYIERAVEMLADGPRQHGGFVVVFHRDNGSLHLEIPRCYQTSSFPEGAVRVADDDEALDSFAPFVAGFVMQDVDEDKATRSEWRNVCRALGRRGKARRGHLLFNSPELMLAFTKHAASIWELAAQIPSVAEDKTIKNRQARLHLPSLIVGPTEIRHLQQCVRWAQKHGVSLAVLSGGHSGHCVWPNAVSVDMKAFNKLHIITRQDGSQDSSSDSEPLVVAEAGCKTGDIVHQAMAAGLAVPLGARPSVGAGLWLQGGIGHLARLHGLACDAIIGAVLVSVDSGQVLCVGHVPNQHRPADAVCPENETDLLWAIKGAGTNFGIIVSVTFRAYPAPTYLVRNWHIPLSGHVEARRKMRDFDELVARELPRNCSADAYLYWDAGQLRLGVTMLDAFHTSLPSAALTPTRADDILGPEDGSKVVDGAGLFETEMYVSGMHGGHGGGKTSSFKRCLFLENIGSELITNKLVAALESRPSPLCYLHLLHGGGAVSDVAADASAFGCRDWEFACVVTGVWPRNKDGTEAARSAVSWVYNVAAKLLPLSSGVYGADLGPDPRDAVLAAEAFGPNRPRLCRLKQSLDPHRVLAYACPLPKVAKLIILVTGESCAGKDFCADVWVSAFCTSSCTTDTGESLTARVVSISDSTKREYAAANGANLDRLLSDRAYKEQHRPGLTAFFQEQVRIRPQLPEEHFLDVVHSVTNVDVLLITGMRDEAPVAASSHLVPGSRLLEVRVQACAQKRRLRRGGHDNGDNGGDIIRKDVTGSSLQYRPILLFDNDATGREAANLFAEQHLLLYFHEDLQRLANMVPLVADFPRPGVEFRHVLDISQQPGGLSLCASLLEAHFPGDWAKADAVACCEAGGFVYASALALHVDVPMVLIREAGKLPPPTISVAKSSSYISSSMEASASEESRFEMDQCKLRRGSSVVVVDDVLSTGKTVCAVLQLLSKAGVDSKDITIMVVAEFPAHRGRELLRERGFGRVGIQSLLVFGGS